MAQVLKIGLEKAQTATDEAYEKGHQVGLKRGQKQALQKGIQKGKIEGFEFAKKKYAVSFYCARCEERHLTITSDEAKEDAANLMHRAGWHDPDCEG